MRDLMRYLRRAGLLSTLLIGGVVGGLTAPLPSEAGTPTLTLQIDGQIAGQEVLTDSNNRQIPGNSILGAKLSACSAADAGLGYTDCYAIVTSTTIAYKASNGRLYRIQNAPNATARLRVADNAGLDGLSIAGVQFVPVNTANQSATTLTIWNNGDRNINTTEEHKLVFTMTQTFDSNRNSNNAGLQSVGLRTGGEFWAGPLNAVPTTTYCISGATNVACDTVNNKIEYSGVGQFTPTGQFQPLLNPAGSPTNSQPLSKTIGTADKGKAKVSFGNLPYSNLDMAMVEPTYPRFDCNTGTGSTICNETLTQTMTVTLKGPDTYVATGDGDFVMVPCFTPDKSRLTFLVAFAKKVVAFLQLWVTTHPNNPNKPHLVALIDRVNAFLLTADVPTDPNCPAANLGLLTMISLGLADENQHLANGAVPSSPPVTGTLRIRKSTSVDRGDTFNFNISGPSSSSQSIVGSTDGASIDLTVDAGTYSVTEVNLPANWSLSTSSCAGGGTENFTVPAGVTTTCIFINTYTPPPPPCNYNGHDYTVIDLANASWGAARNAAKNLTTGGGGWDLATITSAGEQAFINTLLPALPLPGIVQYWVGGFQPDTSAEPDADWQWINGEGTFWNSGPVAGMYQNWGTTIGVEPNNHGSLVQGVQNHVALDNRYGWGWDDDDDFPEVIRGYVAERVCSSVIP